MLNAYLEETNNIAVRILSEEEADVSSIIDELIKTSWGGSNEEQGRAVQLLKGLAFSDDPRANKFMKALDKFTSGLDPKEFEEDADMTEPKAVPTMSKYESKLKRRR